MACSKMEYRTFDKETIAQLVELIKEQKVCRLASLVEAEKANHPSIVSFVEGELSSLKALEHILRTEVLGQTFYCGHYYDNTGKQLS